MLGLILSVIGSLVFLVVVVDVWLWIGVFQPDLAIAHDVYLKAIK